MAKKPELFSFAEPTARKLGKFAHSLPDTVRPPQVVLEDRTFCRLFKAPDGGIPAREGLVVRSVWCEVWLRRPGVNTPIEFTGKEFWVHNWTKQIVCATGDRYGVAERDGDGTWWVIAADCSDTG